MGCARLRKTSEIAGCRRWTAGVQTNSRRICSEQRYSRWSECRADRIRRQLGRRQVRLIGVQQAWASRKRPVGLAGATRAEVHSGARRGSPSRKLADQPRPGRDGRASGAWSVRFHQRRGAARRRPGHRAHEARPSTRGKTEPLDIHSAGSLVRGMRLQIVQGKPARDQGDRRHCRLPRRSRSGDRGAGGPRSAPGRSRDPMTLLTLDAARPSSTRRWGPPTIRASRKRWSNPAPLAGAAGYPSRAK